MYWMIRPLRRYFDFKGRARRKEYWMFFLFTVIVTILLSLVDTAFGLGGSASRSADVGSTGASFEAATTGGILTTIFSLAILVPSISVGVRRLHDTDRRGWWLLGPVLPYVALILLALGGTLDMADGTPPTGTFIAMGVLGLLAFGLAIVTLVFLCLDGTHGANRFGPDPKDPSATADLKDVFS